VHYIYKLSKLKFITHNGLYNTKTINTRI